jgi:tetratricopeptide (TPR) repeat protein
MENGKLGKGGAALSIALPLAPRFMIANENFSAPCRRTRAASRWSAFLLRLLISLLAGLLMLSVASPVAHVLRAAQQGASPPQDSSAPPPPKNETVQKSGKKPASAAAITDATAKQDNYDPLHAAKDVEVGSYYMRKGDVSAAIDRFKHAITLREDYAKPRLLLGECYEKKNDPENAIHYYQEYLKVLPHAPDAKKIRDRIAKLTQEQQQSPR